MRVLAGGDLPALLNDKGGELIAGNELCPVCLSRFC